MRKLIKDTRTVGKNKEFLNKSGFPLSLGETSVFLTEKFIYDLRKQAVSCDDPVELLWYIVKHIEQQGKIKRGQSEEDDHSLAVKTTNIFCHTFGVNMVQAKFIAGLPPFDESFEKCKGWITTALQDCLDLYRDEWEALIKEYEMEHGES